MSLALRERERKKTSVFGLNEKEAGNNPAVVP